MAQEDQVFLLTQEAYDKMQEELKWREGEYRDEIIAKVSAARAEGDLSENGGYHAAREAQRVNQGRIEELTFKLRHAKILTLVSVGSGHGRPRQSLLLHYRDACSEDEGAAASGGYYHAEYHGSLPADRDSLEGWGMDDAGAVRIM